VFRCAIINTGYKLWGTILMVPEALAPVIGASAFTVELDVTE
jgi:hypothetical protein